MVSKVLAKYSFCKIEDTKRFEKVKTNINSDIKEA